jgi:hypothetical protein
MKQRKNIVLTVLIILLAGAAIFPHFRTVAVAQPGEANDPLVTRRYVDERVDAIWTEIQLLRSENAVLRVLVEAGGVPGTPGGVFDMQAITAAVFAEVMLSFELMYGEMLRSAANQGERSLGFTVLNPSSGQTLIIESGTEIVLRTGTAVVVAGPNGLLDMTTGQDVANGQSVGLNHLLIAPRTDGRGIRFTSDAYVMVRGAFTLVS